MQLCPVFADLVTYIRDHGELGFPSQKNHPQTGLTTPSWNLGSIGYTNQAQKCIQYHPKDFQ